MEKTASVVLPLIHFKNCDEITIGPVLFRNRKQGQGIECHATTSSEIFQALYLLYFSANAQKIFYGMSRDSIASYFKTSISQGTKAIELDIEKIDVHLLAALSELSKEDASKTTIIQAIYYLLEGGFRKPSHWEIPLWHHYLLIGLSFEVLFNLNPMAPQADLRQILRPVLHLKFSRPVELLWKWVDLFYTARKSYLLGQHPEKPDFTENTNVQSPLFLIGEKLLIFSIYDLLFQKHLLVGNPGTLKAPDDFAKIHANRLLVYFWPEELIEKRIKLMPEQSAQEDLYMLESIKRMHKKLQSEGSPDQIEFFKLS